MQVFTWRFLPTGFGSPAEKIFSDGWTKGLDDVLAHGQFNALTILSTGLREYLPRLSWAEGGLKVVLELSSFGGSHRKCCCKANSSCTVVFELMPLSDNAEYFYLCKNGFLPLKKKKVGNNKDRF